MEGIAKYSCKPCNFINNTSQLYIKHLKTDKHKKKILEFQDKVKDEAKDEAKDKVKDKVKDEAKDEAKDKAKDKAKDEAKDKTKQDKFICKKCMKEYTSNSGLWKHKKICKFEKIDVDCQLKNLIQELHNKLLDEIKDLKKLLVLKSM